MSNTIERRYTDNDYLAANPDWHSADSRWKAHYVVRMLSEHQISPQSICEVGCGSGGILAALREQFPSIELFGFDISPNVQGFWQEHSEKDISFICGDFFRESARQFDVVMLMDVFEHVPNPWQFLGDLHAHGKWFVFHVPLEFTALGALREEALLRARSSVGHIHYYTPKLATALLEEAGFEIIESKFTQAFRTAPNRSVKTRLANIPRALISFFDKSLCARLLGGDTLLVLAKSAASGK